MEGLLSTGPTPSSFNNKRDFTMHWWLVKDLYIVISFNSPDLLEIFFSILMSYILISWRYSLQFPCQIFWYLWGIPFNSPVSQTSRVENSWWPWKRENVVYICFRPLGTREVVSLNISSVTTTSKRKQIHSELQRISAEREHSFYLNRRLWQHC